MGVLTIIRLIKMKNTIIAIGTFLLMFCTVHTITAQDNRTLETKVADILAQLPAKDFNHSDKLMEEITTLKTEGILQFCDMLVPLGTGDDTKARFAIHSLAVYAGRKQNSIGNNEVENALLTALENVSDKEIKTFLIERLAFCGSNSSVKNLSKYLLEDKQYSPALATLTSIGTPEASEAVYNVTKDASNGKQPAFIDALGTLRYKPAIGLLQQLATSDNIVIRQKSLMALAEITSPSSYNTLFEAVKNAEFNLDETKAILAYIHYGKRLSENGDKKVSSEIAKVLLKNCTTENQLHFRSAAIHLLRANEGKTFTNALIKEFQNQNQKYREAVLEVATQNLTGDEVLKWVKAYKKFDSNAKPQLIRMLGSRKEKVVFDNCILSAVNDSNEAVRISGIKALAFQDKAKAFPVLLQSLRKAVSNEEFKAIEETLLRICDAKDNNDIANNLNEMGDNGKKVLVNVLATRKATAQFNQVLPLTNSNNESLKTVAYSALPSLTTSDNLSTIINLLNKVNNEDNATYIQQAIIDVLDHSNIDNSNLIFEAYNNIQKKERMVAVLPVLKNKMALNLVVELLNSGNEKEKTSALNALANWRNNDAIPYLFQLASAANDDELRSKAFDDYLSQVIESTYPDDQKLLLIKKLMPYSKTINEKIKIIDSVRDIKTFLSLVFVSNYLDTEGLVSIASNTAIRIAISTPGEKDGLSGDVVRSIISKSVSNLTGPDSQYTKIDVMEFLDKMPRETGFVPIFNGKDLTGWKGLVENPIARSKMSDAKLSKKQVKADQEMAKDWVVQDGAIVFVGEGYKNICTVKKYGDFEMLVDWKIGKGGDSGIYLRGTPQVQIWDTALVEVGAQVGSGGLYNNQINESKPLKVADNPVNEWNTFRIKMVGERVTVYLNGELVVDNVTLENYWDRNLSIFPKEAIELQAHGEDVKFKNIYIREITSGDVLLSDEEKVDGFKSLFNGKDLDHWIGNKIDYLVENSELVVRPKQGEHGNLYTAEEYSDFIFRFEFKLTPGANNGLGIHAPLEGDVAYVGKELQILDNTAAIYENLKPYQYHGSVYGIIPAKRGYLKPVGEWNYEEVIVKGNDIKIILNGTVIVDGNFKEATKNGTMDGNEHPGLKRNSGHIAFLGHGSELQFRNIRIKNLKK